MLTTAKNGLNEECRKEEEKYFGEKFLISGRRHFLASSLLSSNCLVHSHDPPDICWAPSLAIQGWGYTHIPSVLVVRQKDEYPSQDRREGA